MIKIGNFTFYPGQAISCSIEGDFIEGHIHIEDGRLWICHDNRSHDGDESPERWGHRYSWTFNVTTSGRLSDAVSDLTPLDGVEFKDFTIDSKLKDTLARFLKTKTIHLLFYSNVKPFEIYNSAQLSDKTGFITLLGASKRPDGTECTKKTDIKFSRFCKKVSDALENKIFQDDQEVEKVYNNFVAIQEGSFYKLEIVSGEDIKRGYTSANYASLSCGTLHKSCMTEKFDFLDIYTKNPNQVQLAILSSPNGIEARCIIWSTSKSEKIFDRVYYTHEWCEKILADKLKEMSYLCVNEELSKRYFIDVVLENYEFEKYPYIDNFKFRMDGSNRLHAIDSTSRLEKGRYHIYTATNGSYSNTNI